MQLLTGNKVFLFGFKSVYVVVPGGLISQHYCSGLKHLADCPRSQSTQCTTYYVKVLL